MKKLIPMLAVALLLVLSCQSTQVSRVSADEQIDLSGRWNDSDSRMVAEKMVSSMMSFPWLGEFTRENDRKPVLVVGSVRNRSSEHIETTTFIKDIEREMVKSGKVRFVASSKQRDELRDEKEDQQSFATEESAKALAAETGADFMLMGYITTQVDAVDGKKVILYKVDMELIHIETMEKVWIETKEIKKYIEKSKVSW
jgi:uncharacterized protein (TIGR02722 family)